MPLIAVFAPNFDRESPREKRFSTITSSIVAAQQLQQQEWTNTNMHMWTTSSQRKFDNTSSITNMNGVLKLLLNWN